MTFSITFAINNNGQSPTTQHSPLGLVPDNHISHGFETTQHRDSLDERVGSLNSLAF
jgi:hypothetical protein